MSIEKVLLGKPRSFCAGVKRATEILDQATLLYPQTLYCLKEIVHNNQVIEHYKKKNIVFVQDLSEIPIGETVIFSAHGISPMVREAAQRRQLNTIDATCPFVKKVHTEAKRYAREGYSIILIGYKNHDEVIGIIGEAPDNISVINSVEEANAIYVANKEKVAVLTQTTLSLDDVKSTIDILKKRFPKLAMPTKHSNICLASQNRQNVVKKLAEQSDIIIVLGATSSSNSNRLVEIAQAQKCPAFLVSTMEDIKNIDFKNYRVVGLTAGASTPENFIQEISQYFKTLGATKITETTYYEEKADFPLPKELLIQKERNHE